MSPSSWLMDSACCNHMTPHSSLFSKLKSTPHPLNIHIVNGSIMSGHNIGSVSTSNLSIPGVFNISDLSYNLFSMGQLAEFGYRIIFDYSRCTVRDPKTGQELGTGPKVGSMFPVDNLRLPLVILFLLLQLLLFLLFLLLHFGMPDLVTHLPFRFKNWLLEVC